MTKGKSVSKRLTLLSLARNLTSKQEHQLVALADRTRKMEAALTAAQEREERLRALATAEGPDVSYGGYGVTSTGCYAGNLAHRVLLVLDEAETSPAQKQPETTGTSRVESLPCPDCGQYRVLCYLLNDEEGKHMHTHYVCTFWGSGQPKECGWHGWSVPGWREADS